MPADFSYNTAAGRWARLGPYYAMFPIPFAERVIMLYTRMGDTIIDPFCGRGTTPFIAMVYGRKAIGCDVNPVAWLYSKTKTDPYPEPEEVRNRIYQIREATTLDDVKPANEFQELAFCRSVLGFINAARRELKWRHCQLDRTVATMLIQHLHDKKGRGLSNQLRHSRALSPGYCIRWWRENGHHVPPQVEPQEFLTKRIAWRYAKGTPRPDHAEAPAIALGKAESNLPHADSPAKLVLTSPPYSNVTNYRADNWLRLWALGAGPALPDWNREQKFTDPKTYSQMLRESLASTRARTYANATWYIRSDARLRTKQAITEIMVELLPDHRAYERPEPYNKLTQTALYGDSAPKPGEIDLLFIPPRRRRRGFTLHFGKSELKIGLRKTYNSGTHSIVTTDIESDSLGG